MNTTFPIKDSIENKIGFYHLVLFLVSLPFDRFYSTLILISFVVHTLIFFRSSRLVFPHPSIFILQSVFYLTLISSTYALSFTNGLEAASRQLAIFLFPVLFSYSSIDLGKYRPALMRVIAFSCAFIVLYLYGDAVHVIRYNHLSLRSLFSWEFVNQNFSLPINMHATYLSMLLVLAIVYCMQQILGKTSKRKPLYIGVVVILMSGLVQLSSKSAIFSLIIILLTGVPFLLLDRKNRVMYFACSIGLLALLISFVLSFQIFRDRYIVTLKDDLYENGTVADVNGRHDRWNVALDLIRQAPFFGTGSGSEISLLKESYFERKMYGSYLASLNAHNQYLSLLINSGLFGLLIYLVTLGWGMYQALRFRDILLFSFIVMIMVVSVSEDILDVNKGIFIYSFFFSFLFRSMPKREGRLFERIATRVGG